MASRPAPQSRTSRAPLIDANDRVNNASIRHGRKPSQPENTHPSSSRPSAAVRSSHHSAKSQSHEMAKTHASALKEDNDAEKRASQASNSSSTSSGKRKTHIGPWQLGRTLGKGSVGRVRLARHNITKEQVAVKIMPKHGHAMTQAGSLAAVDDWDRRRPEFNSEKRMPLSIEREVAILKLIDHPNIMKLYDIWENRSEIYLVLEFVENGDLFDYINRMGSLPEPETIFYFRQIISALDYCHSFNICHRDLKPENILLTKTGQVKIADFGMAAIQQGPTHKLRTACGSPHYAAPELVDRKSNGYSGATVDIWSMGVILYACLCACLPFDDTDMNKLLLKAKKAVYVEPKYLSPGAKDLLRKLLRPNPAQRITISQIWKHELIVSYDYLDNLNGKRHDDNLNDIRKYGRETSLAPQDIDTQTLRQLQSMWHTYTEKQLAAKLIEDEPNDQKLFYWLLFNYREKRLENYVGDLTYSASDYHLLRPANWTKRFTTVEFPSRHGRTPSRFTVISNVATDENSIESVADGATIRSYDPYKASRILDGPAASHAKITVHRDGSIARSSTRASNLDRMRTGSLRSNSTYSKRGGRGGHLAVNASMRASRRSLTSIKSTGSSSLKRPVSRARRGVNFNHQHGTPVAAEKLVLKKGPASIAGDDTTYDRDHTSPASPCRQPSVTSSQTARRPETQSLVLPTMARPHRHGNDEIRQLSHSIAEDCDQAFNSSLLSPDVPADISSTMEPSSLSPSMLDFSHITGSSSLSVSTPTPVESRNNEAHRLSHRWDARPLPQAPPPTDSVLREIRMAKRRTAQRENMVDESPGHVNRMMEHLDNLLTTDDFEADNDQRIVSAPIYSQYSTQWGRDAIPLPSISEGRREVSSADTGKHRTSSAPTVKTPVAESTPNYGRERTALDYLSRQENTICMVSSPGDGQSPVRIPAPLNIRKKVANSAAAQPPRKILSLRQQYAFDEIQDTIPEEPPTPSTKSIPSPTRKKSSWFKRGSKDKDEVFESSEHFHSDHTTSVPQTSSTNSAGTDLLPAKKRSFSFAFWRNSHKSTENMKLSVAGKHFSIFVDEQDLTKNADVDFDDPPSPEPVRMFSHPARPPNNGAWKGNVAQRNIEPQQNWLARLFRVKPATEHICFTLSRRQTRQEIAILLKEWRRYGIRDVQVDKDRNIVFGRVGAKNYLAMKEVSFAAEIMTVIEHGKRSPLSIVRFTQERGAASSFHKVVDTIHAVFGARNLLVVDKHKAKMMIKTLNSR
ncbi:hypothetical protein E8E14_011139 [Neopestalotiopsis sp. 37M]|nr:hypothetical protein E8E14_011139 [Neopestalotiopsis sp. 37M]